MERNVGEVIKAIENMDSEDLHAMDNIQEENPYVNMFGDYIPNPDDPHEFGEYMEDWYDYEWRTEQKEMDGREKVVRCKVDQ